MIVLQALCVVQGWMGALARRARRDEGATLVEYGLLVALIAVMCMVTVRVLGQNVNSMFCSVAGEISGANNCNP